MPPPPRIPPPGVWCPAVTLFDPDSDDLDLASQTRYYRYLSQTGLAGLVILGTNAETFLLTREERARLLHAARAAVGPDFPLMAGVGGHSTKQVLEFVDDAAAARANYVLVLPPAYLGAKASALPAVVDGFYRDVARAAAARGLGSVVYNFPGVCNGVDLDSATIARIARGGGEDGVVVGVKLTCGSVAKITRLRAEFGRDEFAVFGGQGDFLVGGLWAGSDGCIAAFANVFPRTIVRVFALWCEQRHAEAMALHQKAALAEQAVKDAGIAAVKYAASVYTAPRAGIERAEELFRPRRPYLPLSEQAREAIRLALAEVNAIEEGIEFPAAPQSHVIPPIV